jgi:SAM-dependent methyltransferase
MTRRKELVEPLRSTVARMPFMRGYSETNDRVSMESLGLEHPERVNYSASPWWTLRWLLPRWEVRPSDVFLEYGCGKGRVVLDAARRYRFERVVGVEIAPELTAIARALVEHERSRLRCHDVTIVTADATAFTVPDDVTHVYFYNPFGGTIFARVTENLVESLDRLERRMHIIYLNPVEEPTLLGTGRFRVVRRAHPPKMLDRPEAAIYESTD